MISSRLEQLSRRSRGTTVLEEKIRSMNQLKASLKLVRPEGDCADVDEEELTRRKRLFDDLASQKREKYANILMHSMRGRQSEASAEQRFHSVHEMLQDAVESKAELGQFLATVHNPLFSDIPAICAVHHYMRTPKLKERLCAYLLASVKEFERYSHADLLELSNHVDAACLKQGDPVLLKDQPVDQLFLVYSGSVEELRGRLRIEWPEGSFYKLSLLEVKSPPRSTSSFTVKSRDCVLLTFNLAKILDYFDAHFKNKMIIIQDHMVRLNIFSHIDLNALYTILAAGFSISRSPKESSPASPELVLIGQTVEAIYWLEKGRLKKTIEVEDKSESVIPVVSL